MKIFENILSCLRDDEEYRKLSPKGPPDKWPSLSDDEINSLKGIVYGEKLGLENYAYDSLEIVEDSVVPVKVNELTKEIIKDIDLYSIDGSNQRLGHPSFFFIISRAALVKFKYTDNMRECELYKIVNEDLSGVLLVDGNIFRDDVIIYGKLLAKDNFLPEIDKLKGEPILYRYNRDKDVKSPSSQALGIGVKFQQALELYMLKYIDRKHKAVIIKDGPLFSTSISKSDTIYGLNQIFQWDKQVLLCVSKRIGESSLISELLLNKHDLVKCWFDEQFVSENTLLKLPSDQILLSRVLKPGYRTPLIAAIGRARVDIARRNKELTPLACYYMSRQRPHTIIRIEVPQLMWEQNPQQVNDAISVVAWQLDLGIKAPFIQMVADQKCQIKSEFELLKDITSAKLFEKNLSLPEVYE